MASPAQQQPPQEGSGIGIYWAPVATPEQVAAARQAAERTAVTWASPVVFDASQLVLLRQLGQVRPGLAVCQ